MGIKKWETVDFCTRGIYLLSCLFVSQTACKQPLWASFMGLLSSFVDLTNVSPCCKSWSRRGGFLCSLEPGLHFLPSKLKDFRLPLHHVATPTEYASLSPCRLPGQARTQQGPSLCSTGPRLCSLAASMFTASWNLGKEPKFIEHFQ